MEWGGGGGRSVVRYFVLKSERLDQLPKALSQLFLDNEYMIDDVITESHESWILNTFEDFFLKMKK